MTKIFKTKYLIKLVVFTVMLLAIYGFGFGGVDNSITLTTVSGYTSNTMIYMAKGKEKNIAVITLHGKLGSPDAPYMEELYDGLNKRGYTILALTMPWFKNKREGTFEQAIELINEAVNKSGKQRVVVLGHSIGGMTVLRYSARNPVNQVIGIIAVAPGHDPHIAGKLRKITADSVKKAKKMLADGKGKDKARFVDLQSGNKYWIKATAEHYVSFYDPDSLPHRELVMPKIKLPVLLLAGTGDKLSQIYRMKELFGLLTDNPNSRYLETSGSHFSMVGNSANDIADWMDEL